MSRLCPDCKEPMRQETYHGVTIDACPRCAGMWFDEGELGRVMSTDPIALIELEDEHIPQVQAHARENPERRCPDCGRLLDRYRYMYNSPIDLDTCGTCSGFWVDDAELRKIQDWLDDARHPIGADAQRRAELETAIAEFAAEHEQTMFRLNSLRGLFTLLHRQPYAGFRGW